MQTDKKLAYDRQHSRKKYAQYKEERVTVLSSLGHKCAFCGETNPHKLHLHHLEYVNGESTYPKTSNGWSRVRRVREAAQHPERFLLLCAKCHLAVTTFEKMIQSAKDVTKVVGLITTMLNKLSG